MEESKIFVKLSSEIEEVLLNNHLSIENIIANENIRASVRWEVMPNDPEAGESSKEIVTVIIASSALIIAISYAISNVLSTVYRKPTIVEVYENQEMRDAVGNILLDKKGRPIFKLIKRFEIIEPKKQERLDQIELNGLGFVLKIKTKEKDID